MTTTTIAASCKNSNDSLHQIRIVIADDHPVARIGIKNMLQGDPGLEVLGEVSDRDEAITATLEMLPDICFSICRCPVCPGWRRCGPL
jgi:DNA-binding NarL/FixJ family response regulator